MSKSTQLNTAIGNDQLCAWQPERGVVWIQTRDSGHGKKLSRIDGTKPVARGVAGGYLRTFEFKRDLAWARSLIERYMADLGCTNEPLITLGDSRTSRNPAKV